MNYVVLTLMVRLTSQERNAEENYLGDHCTVKTVLGRD